MTKYLSFGFLGDDHEIMDIGGRSRDCSID